MYGISQAVVKKISIPIICFIIGICTGYGGTRAIYHAFPEFIPEASSDRGSSNSNIGLQHLQNTQTELKRSIEYSESLNTNIDRSTEINGRAGEIIGGIEREQRFTSTGIKESKGNLNEAIRKLEENRRIFESVDKGLQNSTTQIQSEKTAE